MNRPFPWPWLVLLLLVLLPGPAGRFLLDLLGGLTLTLLALPLLLGLAGVIGWQMIRHRLRSCDRCGAVSFGASTCPACGASLEGQGGSFSWGLQRDPVDIDPRTATITVEAIDVPSQESSSGGGGESSTTRPLDRTGDGQGSS